MKQIFTEEELKIRAKTLKIVFTDIDGTLTDGFTYYSENGEELKRFNHKDGAGVHLLRLNNVQFGIITGEKSKIVLQRAKKLNADYCFIGVDNKLKFIHDFLCSNNLSFDEIAYIGDDFNDLALLSNAGLSFAVNDAIDKVKNSAMFQCQKKGGYGAFREAVDIIIKLREK